MGLLPIRAAGSFITLKLNVIDDDIPLLLGIKVTLEFPNNLMWTSEKGVKLTRSRMGHRVWRGKVDRHKLHMKQRNSKEEKIYWKERIRNEKFDRKRIKDLHLRFVHASK